MKELYRRGILKSISLKMMLTTIFGHIIQPV